MGTQLKHFALGTKVADMHYGWNQLNEHYVVGDKVTWLSDDTDTFIRFIEASACHTYENKMLVIIGEPDSNGWWTAAWCYDGHRCGVCKIVRRQDHYNIVPTSTPTSDVGFG